MREVGIASSVLRETRRHVYVLPLEDLAEFPEQLDVGSPRFVLFLAADFSATLMDRGALSDRIIDAGCVYFCAWGTGCERMHDIFDDSVVVRELDGGGIGTIMTTWHDKEPLEEAAKFALVMAEPDDHYAEGCNAVVLATAGDPQWSSRVEAVARKHVI